MVAYLKLQLITAQLGQAFLFGLQTRRRVTELDEELILSPRFRHHRPAEWPAHLLCAEDRLVWLGWFFDQLTAYLLSISKPQPYA